MVGELPARLRTTARDWIEKMMATLAETASDRRNTLSPRLRWRLRVKRQDVKARAEAVRNRVR